SGLLNPKRRATDQAFTAIYCRPTLRLLATQQMPACHEQIGQRAGHEQAKSAQRARLEARTTPAAGAWKLRRGGEMDPAFAGVTNGFGVFATSHDSASSNALASFRSAVSKPSVNQPYSGASSSRASSRRPSSPHSRARS